ncbi:MAG: hypothetical protein AAFU70_07575, partial [Planctomycetota bacterium]
GQMSRAAGSQASAGATMSRMLEALDERSQRQRELLERRLAELSEVTGRTPPLLISGRLFSYQGREYLLPTMFQLERERGVGRVR